MIDKALLFFGAAPQLMLAACEAHEDQVLIETEEAACVAAISAVIETERFDRDVINNCDFSVSDDVPDYFVLRLNAHCREEICESVLLGWFAVEKETGRVFDWDVAEWVLSNEVTARQQP